MKKRTVGELFSEAREEANFLESRARALSTMEVGLTCALVVADAVERLIECVNLATDRIVDGLAGRQ